MRSAKMYWKPPTEGLRAGWSVLLVWGLIILWLPWRWILAAGVSIAVHELCHYGCVYALGGRVYRISLSLRGITMETSPMSPGAELICALAGPLGGLTLLLYARSFPRLALCALFHSCCNLLPIYPLDGGRAVRCVLSLLVPDRAEQVFSVFQKLILWVTIFACLWASLIKGLGLLPLLAAVLLLAKSGINNPCKEAACGVK